MIRILVADDEEKVTQLICNLVDWPALDMEIAGVARNGPEALEFIGAQRPDIVITDIRMPGFDGLELIGRAKKLAPDLAFIIISGYRHFDYARSAIRYDVSDYLLKPVNKAELTTALEKLRWRYKQRTQNLSRFEQERLRAETDRQRLRTTIFSALASGEGALPGSLSEVNKQYRFRFAPGLFEIALLKLDGSYDDVYTEGLSALRDKMAATAEHILRDVCAEVQVCFLDTTGQMLLNYVPEKGDEIRKALRRCLEEVSVNNSVFFGATFTVARGSAVDSPAALRDSLSDAQILLASRLSGGAGRLLENPAPAARKDMRLNIQQRVSRALESALEIHSCEAVAGVLDDLTGAVAAAGLSGYDLLELCSELCLTYFMLAQSRGIRLTDREIVYDEFRARLDLCKSVEEALACLRQSVLVTFQAALQSQGEEEARPIRLSKDYIHSHFTQPITREAVAAQAGFNPSYFSTLFKKETGQTFNEYLIALRIEKAKELLRDTREPVSRICEAVGYTDLKYFTATFKKYTGIKPGEFRKLYS